MKSSFLFKPLVSKVPFNSAFISVLNQLSTPCFTQKDTPFSPRMLNYYDAKGLLLYSAYKGKKRHFTAEQLYWIYILNDTAKLGYTHIENLQDIKYKFENTPVIDGNYDKFNFLQHNLAFIIHSQMEQHLKIDADGSYSFFTYHNLQRIFEGDNIFETSHIDIALGPIAKKVWANLTGADLVFKKPSLSTATFSNKELIQRLESDVFERIEIVKRADGSNEIKVMERNPDPSTYDLNANISQMKNGKTMISDGVKAGKALSLIREKRIADKN